MYIRRKYITNSSVLSSIKRNNYLFYIFKLIFLLKIKASHDIIIDITESYKNIIVKKYKLYTI